MKIDVEDGEYHAMLGGIATLQRCRPVIVFEASVQSTGFYDVTAADLYGLITGRLGLRLSTMDRWLRGRRGYTAKEFAANWQRGPEFYFIAYDLIAHERPLAEPLRGPPAATKCVCGGGTGRDRRRRANGIDRSTGRR